MGWSWSLTGPSAPRVSWQLGLGLVKLVGRLASLLVVGGCCKALVPDWPAPLSRRRLTDVFACLSWVSARILVVS